VHAFSIDVAIRERLGKHAARHLGLLVTGP
jgi:hypothetical protein